MFHVVDVYSRYTFKETHKKALEQNRVSQKVYLVNNIIYCNA